MGRRSDGRRRGGAAAWAQAAPTAHVGGGGGGDKYSSLGPYGRRHSVQDEAGCTRRPPLAPARFEALLGSTSLGSGGDRRRLCAAYASLFGEIVPSLESMSYVGLQWGAAELAHLAESLPLATALSHLSLEDNVEIDDDALELLVPALAAPGHAIRAVELSGTMATEAARRGIDRRLLPERCAAWEEVTASDGRVYYHDKLSGKTSWDRPAGGVGGKTPRADKGDYDHLFVVMVAGERGAGKTALIRRFVEGKWLGGRAEKPTAIAFAKGFGTATVRVAGRTVRLQVWDSDGDERKRSDASGAVYFRSVHGALVVYDAGDRSSFRAAPAWLREVRRHARPDAAAAVVATKSDAKGNWAVSERDGARLAAGSNLPFVACSARTGDGVDAAFFALLAQMLEERDFLEGAARWPRRPKDEGLLRWARCCQSAKAPAPSWTAPSMGCAVM